MKVKENIKRNGSNPYKKWFDKFDSQAAAKVTVAKARIELGNLSRIKWIEGIGEYRIDWGPGYRIYLVQDGNDLIILFGGGTKKKQQSDIKVILWQLLKIIKKQSMNDFNVTLNLRLLCLMKP